VEMFRATLRATHYCDGEERRGSQGSSQNTSRPSADDCSVEEVLYHLYVLQAIERVQANIAAGRTIPHEEVEKALRQKWLRDGDAGPNIN
jgi:predicted transcriptional regulator